MKGLFFLSATWEHIFSIQKQTKILFQLTIWRINYEKRIKKDTGSNTRSVCCFAHGNVFLFE